MYGVMFINSNGYVTEYMFGDTQAEVVDKVKEHYPFEQGWVLSPKLFGKDKTPVELGEHRFWRVTKTTGYNLYYDLVLDKVDPVTRKPIRK